MTKTVFMIAVEYDETKTDALSVGRAIDLAIEKSPHADWQGDTDTGPATPCGQDPDNLYVPNVSIRYNDPSQSLRDGPPVILRMREEPFGASVEACGLDGSPVGSVAIDYFDNKMKALVFRGDADEALDAIDLTEDVRRFLSKQPQDEQ